MNKKLTLESMNKSELLAEVRKLRRQVKLLTAMKAEHTNAVKTPPKDDHRTLLDESSDPTFIVLPDETCVYANNAFVNHLGKRLNNVIGKPIRKIFRENEANQFPTLIAWVIENRETKAMDTRVRQKDGDHFYISTAKPIFDKENDLVAIVCVSKEITYRKKIEEELRYIISHDTLTGLYNRHFFQTELQRLQHGRQFPVSVVMLDVDRLDTINHKYGRKTGDAILVKVGAILKVAFRMEEIIARIGDDEFAVLLPKTGERQLADIVSRLKKDIDKAQDPLLKLTLSTATAKEGDLLTEIMKQTEQ